MDRTAKLGVVDGRRSGQFTSLMKRRIGERGEGEQKDKKHTTGGIPRWSPTLVLVARFSAYVWQSGRDAQFSLTYGRMYKR
jgi:hypothetical protein